MINRRDFLKMSRLLGLLPFCRWKLPPGQSSEIHTSDLGWIPGENVTAKMQTLISSLQNGDTVVFDGFYRLAGNYRLNTLNNITFRGGVFDCLDGLPELAIKNGLPLNTEPIFEVGNNFTAEGVTFTQGKINPLLLLGGGNKTGIRAQEKSAVTFTNLVSDCIGWTFISLRNTPGAVVKGCTFDSLKDCIYLVGACDNIVVSDNLFTGGYTARNLNNTADQIFFDGVKTVHVSGRGPRNAIITENKFINILRDCIDTTGGLKDGIISHNVMKNAGITCLDLKSLYNSPADIANGPLENTGVRFECNYVSDIPSNALVVTTEWTLPSPDPSFVAGPVLSQGNIYKTKNGFTPNFVLNKNAKGVQSMGDVFIGRWSDSFIRNIDNYIPSFVSPSTLVDAVYIP